MSTKSTLETESLISYKHPPAKHQVTKRVYLGIAAIIILLILAATGLLIYVFIQDNNANNNQPSSDTSKPNIIFIIMDDLGYTDTGYYSNYHNDNDYAFSTPNIESLAAKGIKIHSHYAEPVCSG